MSNEKREIVIPSQYLGDVKQFKPGSGTFVEKGKIFSEVIGVVAKNGRYINVVPVKGRYEAVENDFVIGIVENVMSSCWLVDINAAYPALLHVNEVPWKVEFNEAEKYLNTGDCIMAKVLQVDSERKLQVTMNDRSLSKINDGYLIEVEASKVPRLIGKKGSMIQLLKKYSRCRIIVGRNGRIWVEGCDEGIKKVREAVKVIEEEALTYGLTNRIEEMLKNKN